MERLRGGDGTRWRWGEAKNVHYMRMSQHELQARFKMGTSSSTNGEGAWSGEWDGGLQHWSVWGRCCGGSRKVIHWNWVDLLWHLWHSHLPTYHYRWGDECIGYKSEWKGIALRVHRAGCGWEWGRLWGNTTVIWEMIACPREREREWKESVTDHAHEWTCYLFQNNGRCTICRKNVHYKATSAVIWKKIASPLERAERERQWSCARMNKLCFTAEQLH